MGVTRNTSTARRKPTLASRSGLLAMLSLVFIAGLQGCHSNEAKQEAAEAPPSTPQVVEAGTDSTVHVDEATRFPLVAADQRSVYDTLNVTGAVQPDISREVPVLSIANGRVTALHVGLGDNVHKGQLVMEVQSPDVAQAFMSYQTALANEQLAKTTLTRDQLLFDKGAIAKSQLDVAENGETDAAAALRASEQELRILGVDKDHPSDTVRVYAPISGIVVAQNVTPQPVPPALRSRAQPAHSPLQTCRMCGSSAMSMRTTWQAFTSAKRRTSA